MSDQSNQINCEFKFKSMVNSNQEINYQLDWLVQKHDSFDHLQEQVIVVNDWWEYESWLMFDSIQLWKRTTTGHQTMLHSISITNYESESVISFQTHASIQSFNRSFYLVDELVIEAVGFQQSICFDLHDPSCIPRA